MVVVGVPSASTCGVVSLPGSSRGPISAMLRASEGRPEHARGLPTTGQAGINNDLTGVQMRRICLFALALFAASPAAGQTGFIDQTVKRDETSYRYQLYVPSDYAPDEDVAVDRVATREWSPRHRRDVSDRP